MKLKLGATSFTFINLLEFFSIYKDVFFFKEYKFSTSKKAPNIIDCGSHIGIPILYFKSVYPGARILAFEPNPTTFQLLKTNLRNNSIKNVKVNNAALALSKGKIHFYVHKYGWNWGDAGVKNTWYSPRKYKTITVPSVRLSSYVTKPVDLLKIDIEGMEVAVLKDLRSENKLRFVKEIVI